MASVEHVLRLEDLTVSYATAGGRLVAVDGASLDLRRGEVLGLVGESGSGKTTTAMAILGMIKPPGRVESGRVLMGGTDLLALRGEQLRRQRWRRISLIPQGAMNALNPVMRAGDQIRDVVRTHEGRQSRRSLRLRVVRLLESVGLSERVDRMYPHELSGGMKQRVCIAMAIALEPEVIVADEPTSALDVVVQRAVAETLKDVQARLGVSVILIGHDMGLQAQLVDRLGVMYRGRLVEVGSARDIFHRPAHPYTEMLVRSVPSIRGTHAGPESALSFEQARELQRAADLLVGQDRLPLREVGPDHFAAVAQ